jgi:hypothetical protein
MTFGNTVMVAVIGAFVGLTFVAVNGGMLPVPDAGNPMAVLLFVQVKVVPDMLPENGKALVVSPLQYVSGIPTTGFIVGPGFTKMVKMSLVPEQVTVPTVKVGITVKLDERMLPVPFVAVNGRMRSLPEVVAKPIAVFVCVQA